MQWAAKIESPIDFDLKTMTGDGGLIINSFIGMPKKKSQNYNVLNFKIDSQLFDRNCDRMDPSMVNGKLKQFLGVGDRDLGLSERLRMKNFAAVTHGIDHKKQSESSGIGPRSVEKKGHGGRSLGESSLAKGNKFMNLETMTEMHMSQMQKTDGTLKADFGLKRIQSVDTFGSAFGKFDKKSWNGITDMISADNRSILLKKIDYFNKRDVIPDVREAKSTDGFKNMHIQNYNVSNSGFFGKKQAMPRSRNVSLNLVEQDHLRKEFSKGVVTRN